MPEFFFKTAPNQPAFSVETPIRSFEPTRPYPQNPSAIIYRTRFMQLRAYYTKPTPNTPHPNLPQVYFADDVDFQDRTSGLMEWTRIYSTLPDSWTDFESYAYNFPGYQAGIGLNRQPITKTITSRLTEDYFLVGTLTNYATNIAGGDDVGGGVWNMNRMTAASNSTNVPACAGGGLFGAKLAPVAVAGTHDVSQNSNATTGAMTADVFVKVAGLTKVDLQIDDGGSGFANVAVDLNTGIAYGGNYANASVAAVGDGWWRINVGVATANANAAFRMLVLDNNGNSNYTGDGTNGVYAWRAQMVPGSSVPYPTIPPTTTVDGNSYPISNPGIIPVKFGQQYLYNWNNTVAAYLGSGSTPNYNTYIAWVNADQAATSNGANSYSIEAIDSVLNLWNGSVWSRQRRFVKAR
jgi:hypothetical protein